MSLSHEDLLLLSALADGELEEGEDEAALALLARSPEARAFTESLAVLGHAVQAANALQPAPAIDLADAIMARLPTEAAPSEAPAAQLSAPAASAPVRSLSEARARRARTSQVAVAVGALALAAATFFYARARHEAPVGPVALATPSAVEPAGAEKGVEVRAIDSDETSQVSVFYLPAGANMSSSVVVWIDDKGAP